MTTVAPSGAKVVSEQYGAAIATVYDDIYGELDIRLVGIDGSSELLARAAGGLASCCSMTPQRSSTVPPKPPSSR